MSSSASESFLTETIADRNDKSPFPTALLGAILALLFAVVMAYWPVFSQELTMWDDAAYVTHNPYVTNGITGKGIVWAFTTFEQANYHPLTWLSLMLDAEVFQNRPWGYKLTNLLIHLANTVLVILIFWSSTSRFWPSLFVGAFFALHPLHVESVAWVSERKDTLSTLFVLASILFYVQYAKSASLVPYLACLGMFLLSLLSKQMYVTLPALLLLLDYWPLRRVGWAGTNPLTAGSPFLRVSPQRCIVEKLPIFLMTLIASMLIFNCKQKPLLFSMRNFRSPVGSGIRWWLCTYLGKNIGPDRPVLFLSLSSGGSRPDDDHRERGDPYFHHRGRLGPGPTSSLSFHGLVLVSHGISPVVGIIQVGFHAYADRYTYFPLIGIFVMVVWSLTSLAVPGRYIRTIMGVVGTATLLILGFLTRVQVLTWHDSETLARHAMKLDNTNHQANSLLGYTAFARHDWDKAEKYFGKSSHSHYSPATHHLNYGLALLCQGKTDDAQKEFESTLAKLPNEANSQYQLGLLAASQGRFPEAISWLRQSQQSSPALLTALSSAVVHARSGDFAKPPKYFRHCRKRIRKCDWPRNSSRTFNGARRGQEPFPLTL